MKTSEADKLIEALERRYFEIHHHAKWAEAELMARSGTEAGEASPELEQVRAALEAGASEKRAIFDKIAQIEDGLLDDE